MPAVTDTAVLLGNHYRDPAKLQARIALHRRFSLNPQPWTAWVFEQLVLPDRARILEVGGGPGTLWSDHRACIPAGWRITFTDFSPGMVEAARRALGDDERFTFIVADAQRLPLPDASFEAVIANHMLYHVPDRARAVAEFHRVLAPGGVLHVALNGREHLAELRALAAELGGPAEPTAEEVLPLEAAAAELSPPFARVDVRWRPDGLRVTELEPLLAYLASDWRFDRVDPARRRERLAAQLAAAGAMAITKASGMAVARAV